MRDPRLGESPPWILVAKEADLASSARHVVGLRSWRTGEHQSILIYRQEPLPERLGKLDEGEGGTRWFSIVNECPHLGLPLEGGDIEDIVPDTKEDEEENDADSPPDPATIIMCPFHNYDWNLKDGSSSTGMKACTFRIQVREEGELWLEPPGDPGDDYRVIGVRAVSERFADSSPPPESLATPMKTMSLSAGSPTAAEPQTIVAHCRAVLLAPTPAHKVALVRRLVSLFRSGSLTRLADPHSDPLHPEEPYRAPSTKTVSSGQTRPLGKGGSVQTRIRMLHALANIELWAIDLAVDHIARFYDWRLGTMDGKGKGKRIGWTFVADFLKVAEDEAKHFTLLSERLEALGCKYGDLSVHNGLWESALQTSHSLFSRLAIIALVHEARGLDSNPMQIRRCRTAGDGETARVLEIIHADEITHVAAGHRHFTALCAALEPEPVDPVSQFRLEVSQHFWGHVKGPFNVDDRDRAGIGREWYEDLGGRGTVKNEKKQAVANGKIVEEGVASGTVTA
ncbi:hypothetical protein JCM10908_004239 [Rhodotorula pacifica]|uniref:uncharacterized protein n=1 Tax=Rhodotorula pacifica TaxID=1495444 RepID=UPI0031813222